MRNLLIAVVLLLTAGAFYSALWYKSEVIENDITARVTSALEEDNARNVAIDVDGRHVTLSGIVHDEATETAYLDTANDTYGALGPIDGLTYQADGGYVSVVKSATGISLRGTVPNEDARAALVAQAEAATDGTVDDQLMIAGPEADWQSEASYGLTQMAGLKEGTLMAAAGTFALSGMTDSDPASVSAAFADRDGWETFVSSPAAISDLSGNVAQLNADLADRDGRIVALEGEVGTLTTDVEGLRAALTEEQATKQTLTAELGETKAKVTAAAALAATLTSNVAARDDNVSSLQVELDGAKGTIADLTTQVADRDSTIADLTGQVEARGLTIERLNGDVDKLDAQVAELQALNQSTKGEDTDRIAALTQDVADRDGTITSLQDVIAETLEEGRTKVSTLDAKVAAQGETIKLLEDALGETIDENTADASTLQSQIAERDATIADLNGNLGQSQAELARLLGEVTDLSDASAQVADLTATVAQRDATIASLQAQPASAAPAPSRDVAQQCATQAGNAMEGSRINFGSGTARIDKESVELLERLTGIALACVGEDLTVEVGGHTDAQGSDSANQRLSEARAQAIVAFMVERGVPTGGLKAVGYGEAKPIADNATSEGRAQNRRITFDWQAR